MLITGATSGIGYATTTLLAAGGWRVLGVGNARLDTAKQAELPEAVSIVTADITSPGVAESLVSQAVSPAGRLGAVVNCAGIHALADAEATTDEQWDQIIAVNLTAAFRLAREAIPVMVAGGGGTIVNVASEAGLVAVPNQVAYNVSKAGLIMLTRSIAVDHAAVGVRAMSICPGTTMTPLVRAAIDSADDPAEHERMLASSRPLNRLGRVEEIAATVEFVLRDEVGYMTGSELVIDGGYTAR